MDATCKIEPQIDESVARPVLLTPPSDDGDLTWTYGLVRMGSAELHVNLDGEEIWQIGRTPGVAGNSQSPYWITSAPAAVNAE